MNGLRVRLVSLLVLGGPLVVHAQTPHLDALRQKNLGVAFLEQRQIEPAEAAFRRVVEMQPDEALGYANLAMCYLRTGRLEDAKSWIDQARRRAPRDSHVLLRMAEVLLSAGDWARAIKSFESVLDLDPQNLMAHYGIVVALGARQNDSSANRRIAQQVERLYEIAPRNVAVAMRRALVACQAGDDQLAEQTLLAIEPLLDDLTSVQPVFREALEAVRTKRPEAVTELRKLTNTLRPTSRYRQALAECQPPIMGIPLERFSDRFYRALQRERPRLRASNTERVQSGEFPPLTGYSGRASAGSLDVADLDGDGRDDLLVGFVTPTGGGLQLWRSSTNNWRDVWGKDVDGGFRVSRFFDYNNDGQFEIVAAGDTALRLLSLNGEDQWRDITKEVDLIHESGLSLELLDADNEGDLDLCVGQSNGFRLWQNRGDGTFRTAEGRSGLNAVGAGCRRMLAMDYDDDLDTDLCVIDANRRLGMFANLRHGRFQKVECGLDEATVDEFMAADLDNDGREDLLEVFADGSLKWQPNGESGFLPAIPLADLAGVEQVAVFDCNNDQWLDVVAYVSLDEARQIAICSNRGDGTWTRTTTLSCDEPCVVLSHADVNTDGALDIVALDSSGQLRIWQSTSAAENHWLRVELRGLNRGGTKNNYFGIGSKVEIKSGANYQARFVRRPVTHFGLGLKPQADLLRVIWSNGVPQNQFRPVANQTMREVQVLKGSCPYLYSWNGQQFVFVTDLLAAAPLGLRPAEDVIAPDNPLELMTIPRHQVASRDGEYVFQFTSELWETVYLDEVSLWVVDHAIDTDVFTDQRFRPPPYSRPVPVFTRRRVYPKRAVTSAGQDVAKQLREFDYRYHEKLVPSPYQGIVRPHELTLEFGALEGFDRPLLVLGCWIFWTDTSINVAASQAKMPLAQPPQLEAWNPDHQTWQAVDLPFWLPNGKNKWCVLDVSQVVSPRDARLRLRTSNQIYWDQVFLADAAPMVEHRVTRLTPKHADLHFGGFHRLYRPAPDGPHLYDYAKTTELPLWKTMKGMATRYGNVTDLLTSSDDRLAIFTGGDEVTIRFAADSLPALPSGWVRDFLFYSDGWEKDSDRNTLTGDTVGPLPFHGMSAYPYPVGESYPNDPSHVEYQKNYNTRLIGPDAFRRFVRDFQGTEMGPVPWANEPSVRGDPEK
jgi:tetratricopeptide (TPR) repeat protein